MKHDPINVIKYLSKLVAFPSVSHTPTTDIAAYIAEYFQTLGFRVEHFKASESARQSNVVCSIGPTGTKGLVLSGHMDVVPTEGQQWDTDPFNLVIKDGLLYGRGSVDMKGFIAAAMQALSEFKASDFKKELILIWTYDEEDGCLGSKLLSQNVELLQRPLPENCIIGEPTSLNMICKHNGIISLNIDLTGKAAHSSQPSWGTNTILDASKIIQAIDAFAEQQKKQVDELLAQDHTDAYTTTNVATINGGIAKNVIPEFCRIAVSIRPIPGVLNQEVIKQLKEIILNVDTASKVSIDVATEVPSMHTPCDTSLEKSIRPYAHNDHCSAVAYATDGAHLQLMGMQPLIFGPGSINQAHKPNEYINGQELIDFVPTLQQIVRKHCC